MPIVSDYTAILSEQSWNGGIPGAQGRPAFVTYSFETAAQPYLGTQYTGAFINSFQPFTESEKTQARSAIAQWEAASGIRFLETGAGLGDIRFGNYDLDQSSSSGAAGFAYYPSITLDTDYAYASTYELGGDVFIDTAEINRPMIGLLLHEIGHALGLKHPFEGTTTLASALDNKSQTIMSYTGSSQTLGPLDIQAIQYLYGTNAADGTQTSSWSWDQARAILTTVGKPGVDQLFGVSTGDLMDGGAGNDTLVGFNGSDTIFGGDGADLVIGGDGLDFLRGGPGNDTLGGGPGSDILFGDAGDDDLYGNSGYFNDDDGIDTVDYGIATASITVRLDANVRVDAAGRGIRASGAEIGADTLRDIANVIGGQGGDSLTGDSEANRLVGRGGADSLVGKAGDDVLIGDGPVIPTAAALSINRLYLATLARGPDDAGWADWTARLEGGQTLKSIAGGFVGSQEFQTRYVGLDNPGFVTLLYQNVLGRAPDALGLASWVAALTGGQTQADVVIGFSESAEFQRTSDPETHVGQIYRIYGATLGRAPDSVGFAGWSDQMAGGVKLETIASGFVNSQEFQTRYQSPDDTAFVTLLYQNVLSRAPDQAGLDGWLAQLRGGVSKASVVIGFSESSEYQAKTAAAAIAYTRSALPDRNDTLDGGAGNDTLVGGVGGDTFVFNRNEGGSDHVYRFEAWDTLRFVGFGYANVTAAQAKLTQSGADVVFADLGETITFHDATLAELRSASWLLS